ncbi:MAG: hypothetical protein V4596_02285 [Bdellovibrionota bacterium]
MKFTINISKFVIIFLTYTLALTGVQAAPSVRLNERVPTAGALEWTYRWAIKGPEASFVYEKERLWIVGTDTRRKIKIVNQIRIWQGITVENFAQVNWLNDIEITPLINLKFKKLSINKPLPIDGINCNGTSFYLSGLIKRISYVGLSELNYYLDNQCEQISSPVPNAIGVIERRTDLYHSFKVIGPDVIFEKESFESKAPFKFQIMRGYKNPDKNPEFFKCKPAREICAHKYQDLKQEVERLDVIYSKIFKSNRLDELIKTAYSEIELLADKVHVAIDTDAAYPYCEPDLMRLKYRLESLEEIGRVLKYSGRL